MEKSGVVVAPHQNLTKNLRFQTNSKQIKTTNLIPDYINNKSRRLTGQLSENLLTNQLFLR
jgi:hypothetical protein